MGIKTGASIVVGLLVALAGSVALSSGTTNGCTDVRIDQAQVLELEPVAGYSGDQLANAALIMDAGQAAGYYSSDKTIAVMVAMAESKLRNTDSGAKAGLFQMPASWGTKAERMDPYGSASLFFSKLGAIPDTERALKTLPQLGAAALGSTSTDRYEAELANAVDVVAALGVLAGGSCAVSGDAVALAAELVAAADAGQLRGLVPDHIKEIRWIAQGKVVEGCGIDVRILQVMVIALHTFENIGVSYINGNCAGAGAGSSSHVMDGGGHAVDFFSLGGLATTGADGQSIRLLGLLDTVMPDGSRAGQVNCRAIRGTTMALVNLAQFPDRCNHLHIDVAFTSAPLRVG